MLLKRSSWRHSWSILGLLAGLAVLAWVLTGLDYDRLLETLAGANPWYALSVPLAIITEQLVRAWKWRQLLAPIRLIGTLPLFGAIMAGYFLNLLVPLGISPFARSWLLARLEDLKTGTVLATVAIDRLIDGVIFTGFVLVVLVHAAFPDQTGNIRLGLGIGGAGSLTLFTLLLFALSRYQDVVTHPARIVRITNWLPLRWGAAAQRALVSFGEGIVWPENAWRSFAIVLASVFVKLIAVAHFLLAGLAFGLLLPPFDYVFLVVFLGFLIILSRLLRIPGGFFVGGIFALELLGVPEEQALSTVLLVQASSLLSIASVGAVALWRSGIAFDELRYDNLHAAENP